MYRLLTLAICLGFLALPVLAGAFEVTWGSSWDNVPLQTVLDNEYGPGAIEAATDYEGYLAGDADPAYWLDASIDGDPQCLVYNITHLNGGIPTFVLAWEDLDYGSAIAPSYAWDKTDNDFQDIVVEIQALSPVPSESETWGGVKALFRD
ncbi:MAG: hypothetical protein ABIK96_16210 [bacterium]